jgi:hypothetical protein
MNKVQIEVPSGEADEGIVRELQALAQRLSGKETEVSRTASVGSYSVTVHVIPEEK